MSRAAFFSKQLSLGPPEIFSSLGCDCIFGEYEEYDNDRVGFMIQLKTPQKKKDFHMIKLIVHDVIAVKYRG